MTLTLFRLNAILPVMAMLLLSPVSAVIAETRSGIAFNGHAFSHKIDWNYSQGSTRQTKVSRLGIGWTERLAPYLSGGIKAGYLDISQASHPLEPGKVTTGHYLGIHFHSTPINLELLRLHLNLQYIYLSTHLYFRLPVKNHL